MVISGVFLALYSMNIIFINKIFLKIKNNVKIVDNKVLKIEPNIVVNLKRSDNNNEDSLISLVDVIEESGFIPSLEKDDFSNAA